MTNSAFISYSWENVEQARDVERFLQQNSIETFRDETRLNGREPLETIIREMLKTQKYIVVLLSRNSVQSKWVMTKELYWASESHREQTVAVNVDKCDKTLFPEWLSTKLVIDWSTNNGKDQLLRTLLVGVGPFVEALRLGQAAFKRLDYEKAFKYYSNAVEASDSLSSLEKAKALRQRSIVLYHIEKYREAIEDINNAIEASPLDEELILHRVEVFCKLKDFDLAVSDVKAVLRKTPDSVRAIAQLARIQLQQGQMLKYEWQKNSSDRKNATYRKVIKNSIAGYDKALNLDFRGESQSISQFRLWKEKGQAAELLDDLETAKVCLTNALRLQSNNAECSFSLGYVYHQLGDYSQAIKNYKRAIDSEGEKWRWLYCLGYAHYQTALIPDNKSATKCLLKAILCFSQALDLCRPTANVGVNESIGTLVGRGRCFLWLKKYGEAEEDADRALSLSSRKDKRALLLKSWCLAHQGRKDEAILTAQSIFRQCGDCVMARKFVAKLRASGDKERISKKTLLEVIGGYFVGLRWGIRNDLRLRFHYDEIRPADFVAANGSSPCRDKGHNCEKMSCT